MMSRRESSSSCTSNSDGNSEDLDDRKVFGFLDDNHWNSANRSENLCLELSPNITALGRQFDVKKTKSQFIDFVANESLEKKPQKRSLSNLSHGSLPLEQVTNNSSARLGTELVSLTHDNADICRTDDTNRSEAQITNEVNGFNGSHTKTHDETALAEALTSLKAQVKQLTCEKTHLEVKAITAGSTIVNLEQKLTASEQSNILLNRQLINTKESFQAKLIAREEEMAVEKLQHAKEKETQLQHQQARFATQAEIWKREIAALTKVTLDLKSENHRLQTHLKDEVRQRNFIDANLRTLTAEHASTCEELRKEKERHKIEMQELRSSMEIDSQKHALSRQLLREQLHNLLLEKEDHLSQSTHRFRIVCSKNRKGALTFSQSIQKIRGLHNLFRLSLLETREVLKLEAQKTEDVLKRIQEQASDFVIFRSDRDLTLVPQKKQSSRQELQIKDYWQTISRLKETLAKSERVFDKKHEALKAKYREQNDYLKVTLAVRQGLTTDLHTKRKQVTDLEGEVARLRLANSKTNVKLKHSQEQILALQRTYARDIEKLVKGSSISRKIDHVPSPPEYSQEATSESRGLVQDDVEKYDWQEFVELVAAYEAERQLHAGCDATVTM
ncbi:uncharacterized protein PHALS_10386 [Plasmopara halstedii]|uniref:Uncharacterized protein n=1 Tax=Plasmopara halstedii TaxID=4781 RepID=A0A0P1AH22_PLAHL|nr:uncharacterized protein PHALS_10386 [Plasmopara halstedii]CEG40174.1 hypothetical protein PHALS_10386 [Plasmopara halstedii]|eukprot:XP_024576543.1 hypothetical protein PHALS_10386 [Plasmopara halstedii]